MLLMSLFSLTATGGQVPVLSRYHRDNLPRSQLMGGGVATQTGSRISAHMYSNITLQRSEDMPINIKGISERNMASLWNKQRYTICSVRIYRK